MSNHPIFFFLKADGKRLQAFHILCQCCILGIRWSDFVTNSTVTEKTGLPDIHAVINDRKLALFGQVKRLPEGTPAHDVLHASVESHAGMVPHPGWQRKPGRPWCTWLRDVLKATRLTAREALTAADDREKWRAQRSTANYTFWWWWGWSANESCSTSSATIATITPNVTFDLLRFAFIAIWSNW